MAGENMTYLERATVQMEYVVPLIRDLQEILGENVVNDALAERARRRLANARQVPAPDADLLKLGAELASYYAAGDALEYEVLVAEPERFDLNITRCDYSELMESLGARDIGHLLLCNQDFAAAASAGTELTRTQTRMQGADFCDFRYKRRT